jgi:2-dehydropantoate 2-reductase
MARYVLIGAGGVGGYFGGLLARSGAEVHFVARGAHLDALRRYGLRIQSHAGPFHLPRVSATDDPRQIGPVDYVLLCVKSWDTAAAAEAARPLLGPHTAVVSPQNGVDNEAVIAEVLGGQHVMGGLAYVISRIASPGVIEQVGPTAKLIVGELDGSMSERGEKLLADGLTAGIDIELSPTIEAEIWRKFLYICAFSGTCTLTRSSLGPVLQDPDTRPLFVACMEEVKALADAKDIGLEDDLVTAQLARADGFPPEVKPSMLNDLERGNRLELDWLNGAVVRMGRELGVPTPANHAVYTALKLLRHGSSPHKVG